MTENKTSSNDSQDPLNKQALAEEADKQLLPRLKLMGYILLFFSVCAFAYAFIEDPKFVIESAAVEYVQDEIAEFEEVQHFNSYVIGTSFIAVGLTCMFCVWKKRKGFKQDVSKK